MAKLLPLFPLQLVVFPRTLLPLHVFEDRYKEMVGEAIRDHTEFGIVLGQDETIAASGCTVVVEKVMKQYADGRLDILTSGRRRFEIQFLNQEKAYLRSEVEFFDDDAIEAAPEELVRQAVEAYNQLAEAGETQTYGAPVLDDPQLSFQLGQAVKDLDLKVKLLRSRSELERMRQLTDYLEQLVPRVKQTVKMKHLAPLNGFGHKPEGL